jgi:opacity protein-like surface antigen
VYPAADNDIYDWYLTLRTGGAFWGDTSTSSPAVKLTTPSLIDWGATVGVNIGEHWGVEIAGEQYETTISTTQLGLGEVAEYAYWNVLALGRYRFPLMESRLVPYAIGGVGWAWTNVNDPRIPGTVLTVPTRTDSGFVGTFGGGVDYFIARNISLNGELRYVWPFETTAQIGNAQTTFNNEALQLQVGLRLYF